MSYGVFFRGFIAAEASCLGGAQMRQVGTPHVASQRWDLTMDREFAQVNE
jgi:hypothetical protein